MNPWNASRQRVPKPQRQILQNKCDKDRTGDNEKQQRCEGNIHHIRAMPQASAIQGQYSRHTRGHIKTV